MGFLSKIFEKTKTRPKPNVNISFNRKVLTDKEIEVIQNTTYKIAKKDGGKTYVSLDIEKLKGDVEYKVYYKMIGEDKFSNEISYIKLVFPNKREIMLDPVSDEMKKYWTPQTRSMIMRFDFLNKKRTKPYLYLLVLIHNNTVKFFDAPEDMAKSLLKHTKLKLYTYPKDAEFIENKVNRHDMIELQKQAFEELKNKKLSMSDIEKLRKEMPTHFIYQDNKNTEEYQMRHWALHYSMIGELDKSIECANKGLEINPKSPYLLYMRGRTVGDKGLLKDGIEDLNLAIKLRPKFSDAYRERGDIKKKLGDLIGAEKDYKMAEKIEPLTKIHSETKKILEK